MIQYFYNLYNSDFTEYIYIYKYIKKTTKHNYKKKEVCIKKFVTRCACREQKVRKYFCRSILLEP